jgi:hypothetical protein
MNEYFMHANSRKVEGDYSLENILSQRFWKTVRAHNSQNHHQSFGIVVDYQNQVQITSHHPKITVNLDMPSVEIYSLKNADVANLIEMHCFSHTEISLCEQTGLSTARQLHEMIARMLLSFRENIEGKPYQNEFKQYVFLAHWNEQKERFECFYKPIPTPPWWHKG